MAASIAGAVKAFVESLGLGVSVYRDEKPVGQEPPYITVQENVSLVPEGAFNAYDDPDDHVSELVQVDVWQRWRNPATGAVAESYTLPDAVTKALNGALLPASPKPVSGVQVVSRNRLREPENNIVHHALTIQVRRTL